ncbi:heme ABC transporter ATP-binding protein [Rhabdaerophilum sp. SD176]|uniref:heme ABC transporter ATP-binding protein n=1 Tax=Rhabdaerophilum sp. SD176 TaxID=2983548 RepID=UPI0024DFD027|nr:heme ABC transporter ATP-binding protein [Rhabdaerophilum sp. SD176]
MNAWLTAENAGYATGGRWLVEMADLALHPGKLTVVIGPNGAGKSTLLRLMSGELTPQRGRVTSLGEPIAQVPAWHMAARRVVMAQSGRLGFPFRVHEVVALGILAVGRRLTRIEQDNLVEASLRSADMLSLADRDFQTLSGGEQQRVHFARALCQLEAARRIETRQVLMLDEPIASLDLEHQFALLDAAQALTRRPDSPVAVLAILHDLNLAACYADHLVVLRSGRIAAQGPASEILNETLLAKVFGVQLDIAWHHGLPAILPQARLMPGNPA